MQSSEPRKNQWKEQAIVKQNNINHTNGAAKNFTKRSSNVHKTSIQKDLDHRPDFHSKRSSPIHNAYVGRVPQLLRNSKPQMAQVQGTFAVGRVESNAKRQGSEQQKPKNPKSKEPIGEPSGGTELPRKQKNVIVTNNPESKSKEGGKQSSRKDTLILVNGLPKNEPKNESSPNHSTAFSTAQQQLLQSVSRVPNSTYSFSADDFPSLSSLSEVCISNKQKIVGSLHVVREVTCKKDDEGKEYEKRPKQNKTSDGGITSKKKEPNKVDQARQSSLKDNDPKVPNPIPAVRELVGSENEFIRLYHEGKIVGQNNGHQILRKRRKKFTSLKKKVLEERLRIWKKSLQGDDTSIPVSLPIPSGEMTGTVCIIGFCDREELIDPDEYEEIVENLNDMARKIGKVKRSFVVKDSDFVSKSGSRVPAFVEFETCSDAVAAVNIWNGLVLGGHRLDCYSILSETVCPSDVATDNNAQPENCQWYDWCLENARQNLSKETTSVSKDVSKVEVLIKNALTEEDLEDSEVLEESMHDMKEIAARFGNVNSIRVEGKSIFVVYTDGVATAEQAVAELSKIVLGGVKLSASIVDNEGVGLANNTHIVELWNVLTEDDLSDDECLKESINDITELAQQFATVIDVTLGDDDNTNDGEPQGHCLRVAFASCTDAKKGLEGFNGMLVGGQKIKANLLHSSESAVAKTDLIQSVDTQVPEPMLSGDKVIPERFAQCLRVPKIQKGAVPRPYASQIDDESVKPLLVDMLGELMRLQRRAVEEKNTKARRRIVMGLREVSRGIRAHKVKLVVMANNLDEYGAIDEKCQEIMNSAHAEDIPIFYEFSKRTLGKTLGKSLKVGVAGVQNADGANQQLKKLLKLASTMPIKPFIAAS